MTNYIGDAGANVFDGPDLEMNSAHGGGGGDTLTGGYLLDLLYGEDGNNKLNGLGDGDLLSGGAGLDLLLGGGGDDTLVGGQGADTIQGERGADVIDLASDAQKNETNTAFGGNDDDEIIAGRGKDLIDGGDGDDVVDYSAAAEGFDVNLKVGSGGGAANGDRLVSVERIIGSAFADVVVGNVFDNDLQGGDGADQLHGAAGDDVIVGGAGDDTVVGGGGVDRMVGGDGYDTLFLSDQKTGVSVLMLDGLLASGDAFEGFEALVGTNADDVLYGDEKANRLTGGFGNDLLNGGFGADTLIGGSGNDNLQSGGGVDLMIGGDGDDNYEADSLDTVEELANGGSDLVFAYSDYQLGANLERLIMVQGTSGTGNELNNRITGNSVANDLHGGVGDDTIEGGGGDDTLEGGTGSDTYYFATGIWIVESERGSGIDRVFSDVSVSLALNVENLILTGSAANGYGNFSANDILGNGQNNDLRGLGGNDTLQGGNGQDSLDGGAGMDRLIGGGVNDTLTGGLDADVFVFEIGGMTDRITDFADGLDKLDIPPELNAASFTRTTSDLDGDAFADDLTLTWQATAFQLLNVSSAQIDSADFI